MENTNENQFTNDIAPPPAKPQFLKALCILSFISCGIWILIYLMGTFMLGISEEKAYLFVDKMLETNPNLKIDDPAGFFHQIGIISVISLFANIGSLIGVIMMWRLNRIGFFIYAAAELVTHFFGMNINASANEGKSYGSLIFFIAIDLVFIGMYALNLKYMKKSPSIQS